MPYDARHARHHARHDFGTNDVHVFLGWARLLALCKSCTSLIFKVG
jgi:hypothetical protein